MAHIVILLSCKEEKYNRLGNSSNSEVVILKMALLGILNGCIKHICDIKASFINIKHTPNDPLVCFVKQQNYFQHNGDCMISWLMFLRAHFQNV